MINGEATSAKSLSSELRDKLIYKIRYLPDLKGSSLSMLGEFLAVKALEDNGFKEVREITNEERLIRKNGQTHEITYGLLFAKEGDHKYFIEVKTRRKFEDNGSLNKRYKLANTKEKSDQLYNDADIAMKYAVATPHWIAVQIDKGLYSVYLGSLEQLNGKSGIPMRDSSLPDYICLVSKKKISDALK